MQLLQSMFTVHTMHVYRLGKWYRESFLGHEKVFSDRYPSLGCHIRENIFGSEKSLYSSEKSIRICSESITYMVKHD